MLIRSPRRVRLKRLPRGVQRAAARRGEQALSSQPPIDPLQLDETVSGVAKRRAKVVAAIESEGGPIMTRLARHAKRERVSVRTLIRWLKRYRENTGALGLIPRQRGPRIGHRRLLIVQETIIQEAIDAWVKRGERLPLSWIVEESRRRCSAAKVPGVSRQAVVSRLRDRGIESWRTTTRRPEAKRPDVGARAARPLDIVQVDHTLVDVMIVEGGHRKSIGRPWITVVFDVATRVVLGFHLTLKAPSATSVGLALAMAALPKDDWLRDRGLKISWAAFGLPRLLHLDNGSDFHSLAFQRGCDQYGIRLEYRPPGRPHFGGHIERYLGTLMRRIHGLPGSTSSNPVQRGRYRSEAHARMTLDELEKWIAVEIAGRYQQYVYRGLHAIPAQAWDRGIRDRPARRIHDVVQFVIDFLPAETRRITRNGLQIGLIRYWDPLLARMFPVGTHVLVRFDPRDLSKVYVPSVSGTDYLVVPYADLRRPAITLAERDRARRIVGESDQRVDEESVFAAALTQRRLEEAAERRSSRARRTVQRRPKPPAPKHAKRPSTVDYSRPPVPYEGEEW